MSLPLVMPPSTGHAPVAPFLRFSTLWIQITGTWCNLECAHCINASGPTDPWLKPVAPRWRAAAIREAEELGVKEIYFTGGEPFLHGDILALLALAPPDRAHHRAHQRHPHRRGHGRRAGRPRPPRAAYSLEIRVSLDDTDRETNDRIRGAGAFDKAIDGHRECSTSVASCPS